MINLLYFLHSPALRVAFLLVCVPLPVALYAASNRGQQFLYYLSDTIGGWFETKNPDAPTAKPSFVTTEYIFGQRAVYVGKNYPATPDTDSLETEEQKFHRWILLLWYGRACSIPPFGWFCTRGKGHPGACAARLVPDSILDCDTSAQNRNPFLSGLWEYGERKASMPSVLGAPYDFSSPAYQAFIGAPPSVNATIAAPNFVPEPDYKTCSCAACRDFRNRVFKTDPGALGAPHDEFAARAWQALSKLEQDEEQALDAFRARHQNQNLCKHPKGFSLGRCPVCFMAGDSLK